MVHKNELKNKKTCEGAKTKTQDKLISPSLTLYRGPLRLYKGFIFIWQWKNGIIKKIFGWQNMNRHIMILNWLPLQAQNINIIKTVPWWPKSNAETLNISVALEYWGCMNTKVSSAVVVYKTLYTLIQLARNLYVATVLHCHCFVCCLYNC